MRGQGLKFAGCYMEMTGNGDNSIPFRFPYFCGKDKTQRAGTAKNILY